MWNPEDTPSPLAATQSYRLVEQMPDGWRPKCVIAVRYLEA
jgi:hypothetical protein